MGELEQTVARHDEQIKTLFKNQECLTELTKSMARMAEKMDNVEKGQGKIEATLQEIRERPARNWNTVVTVLITGVVGALIGAAMGLLLK
jgi:predicted  nucleic acid-binding Zn-ribbon protein